MANTPKRVAVIGLDCAEPHLMEKHIRDGHLPTFKKLFEGGVIADNCLVPYPTITPPNWASIATGAWPGTHGVTDFHVHNPGTTPTNRNTVQAFSSDRLKAETLWDAVDKAGKKCIVLNYPGSWPSHLKNGIMVGGSGLSVGENRDGVRGMAGKDNFCADMLITTGIYPAAIRGKFQPAAGWKSLPGREEEYLEMEAVMSFREAAVNPAPATWYVLLHQSDDGYDRATLCPARDFKEAFCTLSAGEWSHRIDTRIKLEDGEEKDVFFRCKLIELSDDAEDFRLYISSVGTTSGWSSPEGIANEIRSESGIAGHGGGIQGYALEWYDMDTFVDINELYTQWLEDAAVTLLSNHQWDLFCMHAHSPDWAYHMLLTGMDPNLNKDEAKRTEAWDAHLKIYQAQDKMVAGIMQACGEDTLCILISDHGAVADGTVFDPYKILSQAGLMVMKDKQKESLIPQTKRGAGLVEEIRMLGQQPDVTQSKCFPQRTIYIYINLKGRDPDGIVEPADYEKVQQQIIDALYSYVDPATGKRPVALALSKGDARILGLYGDGIGDVVYALYPWYSGQHGNILPTAEWGEGSIKGLLSFTGPGMKKGYRLQRTCNLIDMVPTICYVMNWMLPAQAEGAVLYQVLEDPDFKAKETRQLKDALANMERTLQSGGQH